MGGGFEVEMKFLLRTGKPSYKPNQPHTVGWISTEKRAAPRRDPVAPRKRQAPSEKEERDIPDLPGAPTFSQRDIKFEPFFNRWTSKKSCSPRRVRVTNDPDDARRQDARDADDASNVVDGHFLDFNRRRFLYLFVPCAPNTGARLTLRHRLTSSVRVTPRGYDFMVRRGRVWCPVVTVN